MISRERNRMEIKILSVTFILMLLMLRFIFPQDGTLTVNYIARFIWRLFILII